MKRFLPVAAVIDQCSVWLGRLGLLMVMASTLICFGTALARYIFNQPTNAMAEAQWYLYAAVFMLGGGYGLLQNAHVRIDAMAHRFSPRTRNWIDVIGIVVFLFPLCAMMISMGWPLLAQAFVSGEMSFNPGGLIRWPVYALIPLGFVFLAIQGVSELIKRLDFLFGDGADALAHHETEGDY
jgi:TRAP-type mannitol/chloroaromatic compound transport system permease small subunit